MHSHGRTSNWLFMGNSIYTYVVVVCSAKCAIEVDTFTWPIHASITGSVVVWFAFVVVYSLLWGVVRLGADFVNSASILFSAGSFWFGLAVIPSTALISDVIFKV